jgi:dihydrofolate reductase
MSKVFFMVGMSLDGYLAPEGMDLAHADEPDYKGWADLWYQLQEWAFAQQFFRANLGLGDGGDTGPDNQLMERVYARTGASIMGKRMFEGGERFWPEEAPFHTPVFVLTHERRDPWVRPGGTTFHFVDDDLGSVVNEALEAAGGRDVRVAGGADVIQQFLRAGLVDEFLVELAPVFLGGGVRLFDGIEPGTPSLDLVESFHSPRVTHMRFEVTGARVAAPTTVSAARA